MSNFKVPASASHVKNADEATAPVIEQGEQQDIAVSDTKKGMTPEEKAQYKRKLITAFDRGVVHDRLFVPLPPDVHGEWCRNDPLEIERLKTIGFEVDTKYAPQRALNSDGTGAAIVGDVIHMVIPREMKEVIDEIRQEKFMRMNGRPGDKNAKTREEQVFETQSRLETGGYVPTISESKTQRGVAVADVEAALKGLDGQVGQQITPPK